MLSIELIRDDPEYVRRALARRGEDAAAIDEVAELDVPTPGGHPAGRRAAGPAATRPAGRSARAGSARRSSSRSCGVWARRSRPWSRRSPGWRSGYAASSWACPTSPGRTCPTGSPRRTTCRCAPGGSRPSFDFEPRPHWDLGPELGVIDFQTGVKLAGPRSFVLTGRGARLERALINWMLDLHTGEHGYVEMHVPAVVKREMLEGSGNLPKFADNLYHDEEDDAWLIPTAEVPLTNLHRDEVLSADSLPLYYTAYTPCFRREKAAAGRDTRGIKRVRQFDKVEMYKFVEPESSDGELETLLADAEEVCRRLGLPYRVLKLCAGEMGFASAKSYDIEVWAPGCREWLEVSSCSNCTDFQARRAGIRYRGKSGSGTRYVHTLNGSGPGAAPGGHRRAGELPAGRRLRGDSRGAAPLHRLRRDPGALGGAQSRRPGPPFPLRGP